LPCPSLCAQHLPSRPRRRQRPILFDEICQRPFQQFACCAEGFRIRLAIAEDRWQLRYAANIAGFTVRRDPDFIACGELSGVLDELRGKRPVQQRGGFPSAFSGCLRHKKVTTMRNDIARYGIAVAILLLVVSSFIMCTADCMVVYFLVVALIATVALALANRPPERILAWTLTVASICTAIACWASAVEMFRGQIRTWQQHSLSETPPSAAPSSSPATQP
jgi:hypothetical protein